MRSMRLIFASLTALPILSNTASAEDLFPAGVESKSAAIESAIAAKSAPSTLYNPANLSLSPAATATYLEVGAVHATMAYEHPQFDQVHVEVQSPVGTAGVTGSMLSNRLRAGAVIFPTKQGSMQINGMPQTIGDTTHSLAVANKDLSFKTAVGVAWQLAPEFSLGVGTIHAIERRSLTASVVGATTPLVEQSLDNDSDRWIVGLRTEIKGTTLAVALTNPVKKEYKGYTRFAGETSEAMPPTTGFEPAVLATGAGLKTGPIMTELSVNKKFWSAGSSAMREALALGSQGTDIKDITESGIKVSWSFNPRWSINGSYASLPSPWGEGRAGDETSGPIMGATFGSGNAIDRQAVGLMIQGDKATLSGINLGSINLGLMNQWGQRTISSGGANPGHYQIAITTVTASSSLTF